MQKPQAVVTVSWIDSNYVRRSRVGVLQKDWCVESVWVSEIADLELLMVSEAVQISDLRAYVIASGGEIQKAERGEICE